MSAVDKLLGLTLANGWRVTRQLGKNPSGSGGTFSRGYIVEKSGRAGFLKAFDFWPAFQPGVDTASMIQVLTTAYNYEREILSLCGEKRLSKVVLAIDSGSVRIAGMPAMDGTVFYLIFEMAVGDVRVQMSITTASDALWCMRALRDATLGLWQVHKELIAHQDMKPSNVLTYDGPTFKIADFGRSSRKGSQSPHDGMTIAGDGTYAPPELLYGHAHADFAPRRFGCDLYMLGNLAAFLFTGVNMTSQLLSHLDPQHHPANWSGNYQQVLPYLQNAFAKVLLDLEASTDQSVRGEVVCLVRELCEPDVQRRGHPKNISRNNQYSLERYVSHLTLFCERLAITMRVKRAAA